MEKKTCSRCGEEKKQSEFNRNRKALDGLQTYCRACHSISKRRYYKANPEKHREWRRKWKKNNPEKVRKEKQRYRHANPDKVKEQNRRYYALNPRLYNTSGVIQRSPLEEREVLCGWTREAVNEEVKFDYILRNLLSEKTGIEYHVDHIKPVCEGGVHRMWNLAVITAQANFKKGSAWLCEDHLTDADIEASDQAALEYASISAPS